MLLYCIARPLEGGAADALRERAKLQYQEWFTEIPLQPLSTDQSQELLSALLAIPHLPAALQSTLYARAEGNPFYLEELIRMLIGEGIIQQVNEHWEMTPGAVFDPSGVPDTLQGLVMARVDRLPEHLTNLLHIAAVIGFRFSTRVLRQTLPRQSLEQDLQELVEQDFITGQVSTTAGTMQFRHAITSDTIYRSILRQQRHEIHGRVAQAIERLYSSRLDEQVETLANHYANSHFQDRALYYLIRAGNKAPAGPLPITRR